MKVRIVAFSISLVVAATCARAQSGSDRVIAKVNGREIMLSQVEKPLLEAYGLNVLLNVVQLEAAKQEAARGNITITPEDVQRERDDVIKKMFKEAEKEGYGKLLEQFLKQERLTKVEFDIVMQTNAYLRKLAEPLLKGKVTEENLQEAFRAMYGETLQVRHIQVSNLQEIALAKQRLASGEAFDKVAREMSRDPVTGPLGGEMPVFSRQTLGLAEAFKEAAFAMKVGEISDPVQSGGAYHLIKLEKRNAPKAVKFEDVKESVRAELYDRWTQATMKDLRLQLAQGAMRTIDIIDPILKVQYEQKLAKRDAEIKDRQKIEIEMEKDRQRVRQQQGFQEPPAAPATTRKAAP